MEYIDPERWQIKFMREASQVDEIRVLLEQANRV
jgi:uncharacterized protein (DUF1697 family)